MRVHINRITVIISVVAFLFFTPYAMAELMPDHSGLWIPEFAPQHNAPLNKVEEYAGVLYGLGEGQWFRSVDGGQSWDHRPLGFSVDAIDFKVLDHELWLVYTDRLHLFRSTDAGLTWSEVVEAGGISNARFVGDADRLLLYGVSNASTTRGQPRLLESVDQGRTWVTIGGLTDKVRTLCLGEDRIKLWAGTDKGWLVSADRGLTWRENSEPSVGLCGSGGGVAAKDAFVVGQPDPAALIQRMLRVGDGRLMAFSSKNGYRRGHDGIWQSIDLPTTYGGETATISPQGVIWLAGGSLYRSMDAGEHWELVRMGVDDIRATSVAITSGGRILVAGTRGIQQTQEHTLYHSDNDGKDWTVTANFRCSRLYSSGRTVACTTFENRKTYLQVSADEGRTWNKWLMQQESPNPHLSGGRFAGTADALYYSGSSHHPGVWKTQDQGRSWSRVSGEWATVWSMEDGGLFFASVAGIKLSYDQGATWVPFITTGMHSSLTYPFSSNEVYMYWNSSLRRLVVPPKLFDVKGHWAERSVHKLVSFGVISGYPDGAFQPDQPISRAATVKMLATASGATCGTPIASLSAGDLADHWLTTGGYLCGAVQANIVREGDFEHNRFEPDGPISRQELARLVVRAAGLEAAVSNHAKLPFTDADQISPEFQGFVAVAIREGLMTGVPTWNGGLSFQPNEPVTRAQASVVILRLMGRW